MKYLLGFIFVFGIPILICAHLVSLSSPYINERYLAGQKVYEVWIRCFLGYNELAGSFDNEEKANKLFSEIIKR